MTAREVHEADPPRVLAALDLLGRNLIGEGKDAEAERPLRACLRGLDRERPGPPSRAGLRALVQGLLGECLLRRHEYAEAEPLLLAGFEGLSAPRQAWDAEIAPCPERRGIEALERLVPLYDAWGKPERAEPWRKERAARVERADEG